MTRQMRLSRRRFLALTAIGGGVALVTACAPRVAPIVGASTPPSGGEPTVASPTPAATVPGPAIPCALAPIAVPTPAPYPGYAHLDESTGLHVTTEGRLIDLASYRLRVSGKVERPLELLYDELRCLPKVEYPLDLVCPGVFSDHSTFAGTPIAEVLALAGVQSDAVAVRFVADGNYTILLSLSEALDRANLLCYELAGKPLPPMHGFPVRLVVAGAAGGRWAKWVLEVIVT